MTDTINIGVKDIEWTEPGGKQLNDTLSLGQGFTAGYTGSLQSVSIYAREGSINSSATGITLEIYALDGDGLPTGSALATETIAHGDIAANTESVTASATELMVTFSSPPAVTANEGYAILMSNQGSAHYDIYYQAGNAYAGGNALEKASGGAWAKPPAITDYDFSFKVVTTYTQ